MISSFREHQVDHPQRFPAIWTVIPIASILVTDHKIIEVILPLARRRSKTKHANYSHPQNPSLLQLSRRHRGRLSTKRPSSSFGGPEIMTFLCKNQGLQGVPVWVGWRSGSRCQTWQTTTQHGVLEIPDCPFSLHKYFDLTGLGNGMPRLGQTATSC